MYLFSVWYSGHHVQQYTSLGIALAWTIAESTIEELQSLLRRKSLSFENCASLSSGLQQIRTILYTSE